MNSWVKSLFVSLCGLVVENIVLIYINYSNNDTLQGDGWAIAMNNFQSLGMSLLFVFLFVCVFPIVVSFIKDFKPIAFIIVLAVLLSIGLSTILIGTIKYNDLLIIGFSILIRAGLFLVSFGISLLTTKIKSHLLK